MTQFVCDTCGFTTLYKSKFERHQNKKRPCKANLYECPYCDVSFTRKFSLLRHMESRCATKKTCEENQTVPLKVYKKLEKSVKEGEKIMIDELKKLNEKIEKLEHAKDKSIGNQNVTIEGNNNITNSNNVTTNNMTVNVVAYGKEDDSFITDDQFKKILRTGFQSIINYMKALHFDKEHPEYHNVYISNYKDKTILEYNGHIWVNFRADELDTIYYGEGDKVLSRYEDMESKLDSETIRKFKKFVDVRDDDEVMATLKRDLQDILYNNRHIPIETKRKTKKR